eukprot:1161112-Pelagomonas_calceolata.AAC.15
MEKLFALIHDDIRCKQAQAHIPPLPASNIQIWTLLTQYCALKLRRKKQHTAILRAAPYVQKKLQNAQTQIKVQGQSLHGSRVLDARKQAAHCNKP